MHPGTPPPRPGRIGTPLLQGKVLVMALRYHIALPPAGAPDVAIREMNVTVGDGQTTKTELAKDAAEFVLDLERDVAVAMFLVDIDGSGNRSLPSATLAFTSKDDIPPPQPGELSVTSHEQVD